MLAEDTAPDPLLDVLNPRQRAFVENYLIDLNSTQAYIRAGYAPASAGEASFELLRNPKIAAAVERGKAQRSERLNITQDKVLAEMTLLAEACVEHYTIDDHGNVALAPGAPDGAMRAVQSIKKKIRHLKDGVIEYDVELKLWDKPGALKLTGRHVGLFPDRVEHTGKGGGPIETVSEVRRVVVQSTKEE